MNIGHDGIFHKLMNGFSLGLIHDQLEGFWAEIVNGLNSALLPWYWNVPERGSLTPYLFVTQQRPLRLIAEDVTIVNRERGMQKSRGRGYTARKLSKKWPGQTKITWLNTKPVSFRVWPPPQKIRLNKFYERVHVWRHMCFSKNIPLIPGSI